MAISSVPQRPAVLRLPLDTSAADAQAQLARTGTGVALVNDGRYDVGIVTVDELEGDATEHPEWPLARVLHHELVAIDPASNDLSTLSTYRHAAWRSLRRRGPGEGRGAGAEAREDLR